MLVMVCVCGLAVHAQTRVPGKVVAITDGDTLTVLDPYSRQIKVRIVGIDAPERKQDYGNRSRQYLSDLVMSQTVFLDGNKTDRNGRLLAKVLLNGKDAGLELIKAGLAWHFKRYAYEQTPADRKIYAAAEDAARLAKLSLWAMPNPTPPWEFRKPQPVIPSVVAYPFP